MRDAFDVLREHLDGPPKRRQFDFAAEVGASQGLVSLWYNRLVRPTMGYLPALNRILKTTADQWLVARLLVGKKPRARKTKRAA